MNATQAHSKPTGLWALSWRHLAALLVVFALVAASASPAMAQRERRSRGGAAGSPEDYQAMRLLKSAQDLLEAGESERGVKILQELLRQFPSSTVRFQAYLELGRHHMSINEEPQAIKYLSHLRTIESEYETEAGELPSSLKDTYLEGLYLTGVAYFQMRSYGQSFPVLRKITNEYPNTVWANQSYYYIGMCHFSQGNWTKAIEALSLVGTFVDPNSPTIQYAEAGRRFYVRIEDTDLPVMYRLGKEVKVKLICTSGDEEVVTCIPLSGDEAIFVGSIPTELAKAKKNDNTLQVLGGSEVTTEYVDANTLEGKTDVGRKAQVKLVSTATVGFTRGDMESPATAVFLNQPAFVLLQDADLDTGDGAENVAIRVMSRYKKPTDEEQGRVDIDSYLAGAEEDQWEIRDELTVQLSELGESPVRSGRFGGKFFIEPLTGNGDADTSDDMLSASRGDEVVVTYVDELHVHGTSARTVIAKAPVVNEIVTVPRPAQFIVTDPEVAARKNLVEAEAFLELARIFRSMGLADGSNDRAEEGLMRVADVISQGSRREKTISDDLVQQAYKLRWELHLVKKDYNSAVATCRLFSKLFPNSAFVDEALMTVAEALADQGDTQRAQQIYREVSNLAGSTRRAEAMFRIAEMTEKGANRANNQSASVQAYKEVAEKFPDSPYAGKALAKLIDYRIENKDYALANDLLEQTFNDYPDAEFLDSMLLKWVIVSFRMGDYNNALEKCKRLIFEYPESPFAEKANQILPQLEKRATR